MPELDSIAAELKSLALKISRIAESLSQPDSKQLTLEEVRAVLADKSQDGFTAEVRALLEKHGARRLSEIDPAKYPALLANAEALKND